MNIRMILMAVALFAAMPALAANESNKNPGVEVDQSADVFNGKRFNVGIYSGIAFGEAHEFVFAPTHKLSELIWEIDKAIMIGGHASLVLWPEQGLKFNFSASTLAKNQNSAMEDFDWMVPGWDWTHWSRSENTTLERALILDANLSKEVYSSDDGSLNLGVEAGFKRENWYWMAVGGTYIYSTFTFRDTTGSFPNTPGISYEQTINSPYVGASADYSEAGHTLAIRVVGSPFMFAKTVDNHYLRSLTVNDTFKSGGMVQVDIAYVYRFSESSRISLNYSFQQYFETKGDAVYNYYVAGTILDRPGYAGMSLGYHRFGLQVDYTF